MVIRRSAGTVQKQVIENVVDTLQVHPVSAIQYRKCLRNDEEDRPFVAQAADTNIPRFKDRLSELAKQRHEDRVSRLNEKRDAFCNRMSAALLLIQRNGNRKVEPLRRRKSFETT